MRTLVKGQTKTTTPQKKTHPTNPMVLPQIPKPTQNTTNTPERTSRATTRRARTNHLFPIDSCLLDQPWWCNTITELCPDHDDILFRSHSQQLTSHDTILPNLPAGHICLPSERCLQRDPSQHFHGSRPRRTKRRWSWIMGDIVYIYASIRPEPVPQLGLARARIA
ncbi:hypothetical protein N7501_011945 [Penicillium viridicatum]|nr:hypothetical protein N7501_011945 [Penicillium viridicatum]